MFTSNDINKIISFLDSFDNKSNNLISELIKSTNSLKELDLLLCQQIDNESIKRFRDFIWNEIIGIN